MMETVKYVCEFFFCNFWHWLGLWVIVATIFGGFIVKVIHNKEDEK